jgi:hypothetical protein
MWLSQVGLIEKLSRVRDSGLNKFNMLSHGTLRGVLADQLAA